MLPSPLTILAAVIAAFFVILGVARGPVDADFWWHFTTGRLILETGQVPSVDPFSFAYDGEWMTHEWLGEVLIAGLVDSIDYPLTAALFGLATAAALLVPAYAMQRRGVSVRALAPFLVVATYTLGSFVTVRPQVLSWLLLGVLLALLVSLDAQHRHRPWLVIPLMAVWANLHGLYIVGLGVIGVYVLFTLIGRTALVPRRRAAVGMFVGSVIACVLTPSGPAGLLYPLRYLRQDDWGTSFIAEWQAANPTDPRQWGLFILLVAVILLGRRGSPAWLVTIAVVGLLAGAIAVRNQPLTVLMTLPMLATALDARLGPSRPRTAAAARQRRLLEAGLGAVVIAAIAVIIPSAASGAEDDVFPTAAFDVLETERAGANLLVDYDWAGYAIHRISSGGGQVFIDGRSDMYPREVFKDYLLMRSAEPGWEELVATYDVEAILLPPSAPLVDAALVTGWCEAHQSERAALLVPCVNQPSSRTQTEAIASV